MKNLKKNNLFEGKCRFDYPKEKKEKTEIQFIECPKSNSLRAAIVLKRNDESMNMHNRIICQNWRANVDMQIILDRRSVILSKIN